MAVSSDSSNGRDPSGFRRRRSSGRAPTSRSRMLIRWGPSSDPTRHAVVHADLPEKLIRMTEQGLRHFPADSSGWWRHVEREMEALVDAHLPDGASGVEMSLDPDRMQVVLEYELQAAVGS